VAAIFAVFRPDQTRIILILASIGLLLTLLAISILWKHRDYYLDMLRLKTLLEERLGFYSLELRGTNLSFPWNVPENRLERLKTDRDAWKREERWRRGSISLRLLCSYLLFIAIYLIFLVHSFLVWNLILV